MTRTVSASEVLVFPSNRLWFGILFTAVTAHVSVLVLVLRSFGWTYWGFLHALGHTFGTRQLALVAFVLIVFFLVCARLLSQMVVVKARVCSVKDPLIFGLHELPGFIKQNRNS